MQAALSIPLPSQELAFRLPNKLHKRDMLRTELGSDTQIIFSVDTHITEMLDRSRSQLTAYSSWLIFQHRPTLHVFGAG